jgi:hypothetical protein
MNKANILIIILKINIYQIGSINSLIHPSSLILYPLILVFYKNCFLHINGQFANIFDIIADSF